MTDYLTELKHDLDRVGPARFTFDDVTRRHDRRRRNQRIAAGVVGLAVFVAVVLIIGTVGLSDRTQGPAGGAETGPTVTGPAVTGPTETGPAETGPTVNPESFYGLPPEGAEPSIPEQGELVASVREIHVGSTYVYADGRVISWSEASPPHGYREQLISPKGLALVSAGAIRERDLFRLSNTLAATTMRPYVPYRYAICQAYSTLNLNDLPAAAADLLRGKERTFDTGQSGPGWDCYDVTTEQARTLHEILTDAG